MDLHSESLMKLLILHRLAYLVSDFHSLLAYLTKCFLFNLHSLWHFKISHRIYPAISKVFAILKLSLALNHVSEELS